ncbi:hypothetical protein NDU88_011133 [Pleurodeles waltl]|uniref:Integrase catalytic domain-containing protein n=1 Tax=Pleurodeles waltl TaxID=8319 RepID=A0AAV7S2N0_PLEWA|nr:hypothetical protein NDU88_011133 [Pleurodeles waltl]
MKLYLEVELIPALTAEAVIPRIEKILFTHGLISEIKTENGSPFQSREHASYFETTRIRHRRITPRWPQANREVKRFMRTLNKVIRIAAASGQSSEYAIYFFLWNYRQNPYSTTGQAPGHVSLWRAVVDSIPHHRQWMPEAIDDLQVHQRRISVNHKVSSRRPRASDLYVGDAVLLREHSPGSKFRLPFDKNPWTIVHRYGSMVVAQRGTSTVTWNVSMFKKFHPLQPRGGEEYDQPLSDIDQMAMPDSDDGLSTSQSVSSPSSEPVATGSTPNGISESDPSTDRSTCTKYSLRRNPAW